MKRSAAEMAVAQQPAATTPTATATTGALPPSTTTVERTSAAPYGYVDDSDDDFMCDVDDAELDAPSTMEEGEVASTRRAEPKISMETWRSQKKRAPGGGAKEDYDPRTGQAQAHSPTRGARGGIPPAEVDPDRTFFEFGKPPNVVQMTLRTAMAKHTVDKQWWRQLRLRVKRDNYDVAVMRGIPMLLSASEPDFASYDRLFARWVSITKKVDLEYLQSTWTYANVLKLRSMYNRFASLICFNKLQDDLDMHYQVNVDLERSHSTGRPSEDQDFGAGPRAPTGTTAGSYERTRSREPDSHAAVPRAAPRYFPYLGSQATSLEVPSGHAGDARPRSPRRGSGVPHHGSAPAAERGLDARFDEMAEVLRQIWRRLEESESKVDELQKQLQDVDSRRDEWVFYHVHELRREAWTDSHRSSQATLARLHAAEAALQRLQGQSGMVTGMLSTRGRVDLPTNPAFSPTEPSGFKRLRLVGRRHTRSSSDATGTR